MNLYDRISSIIMGRVQQSEVSHLFRTPVMGCAAADDDVFRRIRSLTHDGHLAPADVISGARSVVAFFLPFTREVAEENRPGPSASRRWAEAYTHTNALIGEVTNAVREDLAGRGVRVGYRSPTGGFDEEKLMADWSHRHVAYGCGLGTFGLNNLLLTGAGCCGRLGSFVLDRHLEPTPRPHQERCLHHRGDYCAACVDLCPTGALTAEGFDRHLCYDHLLAAGAEYPGFPSASVCGKCALGPCGLGVPVAPGEG